MERISTFKWQMANTGYDETKIKLLLSTNWIRTIAFILLGTLTILILITEVPK